MPALADTWMRKVTTPIPAVSTRPGYLVFLEPHAREVLYDLCLFGHAHMDSQHFETEEARVLFHARVNDLLAILGTDL